MAKETLESIALTDEQKNVVDRWASSAVVATVVEEWQDADKESLLATILPLFLKKWLQDKKQPLNLALASENSTCQFIFKSGLKIVLPKGVESVTKALQALGIHYKRAALFEPFVKTKKVEELKDSFAKMLDNEETAAAAKSLLSAIKKNPEWKALLESKSVLQINDEEKLLSEIPSIVSEVDEMQKVFTVFAPKTEPYPMSPVSMGAIDEFLSRFENEHVTKDGKFKISVLDEYTARISESKKNKWVVLGEYKHMSNVKRWAKEMVSKPVAMDNFLQNFAQKTKC